MRQRTLVSGILFICSILATSAALAIPTLQFSIEDSTQPTPNSIGIVVSVSTEIDPVSLTNPSTPDLPRHVTTFIPIPKIPQPQTLDDLWKVGLRINPEEIPFLGAVFFTSVDCSGTPWISEFLLKAEFGPTFDPHVVVGDTTDPNIRVLYAADPATPISAAMTFNSILREDQCNPAGGSFQAKPAILVAPDLHQVFPPPYKLNFVFVP